MSWFDSRRYQIFWEVVDLERCPFSLVSIIEELLEGNSSGFFLESREYGRPSHWPRDTLYAQKLALSSPTCCGLSVCIVRLLTQAMDIETSRCRSQAIYLHLLPYRFGRWRWTIQSCYCSPKSLSLRMKDAVCRFQYVTTILDSKANLYTKAAFHIILQALSRPRLVHSGHRTGMTIRAQVGLECLGNSRIQDLFTSKLLSCSCKSVYPIS
jgi:hypothetical protein